MVWPIIIHWCCRFSLVQLYLYHTPLTVKADKAGYKLKVIVFFKMTTGFCVHVCDAHGMCVASTGIYHCIFNCASWTRSYFVTLSWWLRSSGTHLHFGSSVFRSHVWQMPADGGSRCGGFQSTRVQRLGHTWQDGDCKRKIFSFVTLIAGWSSPVPYTMHRGRCLRSLVLNIH